MGTRESVPFEAHPIVIVQAQRSQIIRTKSGALSRINKLPLGLQFFLANQSQEVGLQSDAAQTLQTLVKYGACDWQLLADVAARVDEDVSHETARVLVAGDDEIPGITRISDSIWGMR